MRETSGQCMVTNASFFLAPRTCTALGLVGWNSKEIVRSFERIRQIQTIFVWCVITSWAMKVQRRGWPATAKPRKACTAYKATVRCVVRTRKTKSGSNCVANAHQPIKIFQRYYVHKRSLCKDSFTKTRDSFHPWLPVTKQKFSMEKLVEGNRNQQNFFSTKQSINTTLHHNHISIERQDYI